MPVGETCKAVAQTSGHRQGSPGRSAHRGRRKVTRLDLGKCWPDGRLPGGHEESAGSGPTSSTRIEGYRDRPDREYCPGPLLLWQGKKEEKKEDISIFFDS